MTATEKILIDAVRNMMKEILGLHSILAAKGHADSIVQTAAMMHMTAANHPPGSLNKENVTAAIYSTSIEIRLGCGAIDALPAGASEKTKSEAIVAACDHLPEDVKKALYAPPTDRQSGFHERTKPSDN